MIVLSRRHDDFPPNASARGKDNSPVWPVLRLLAHLSLLVLAGTAALTSVTADAKPMIEIRTSDVALFYKLYDAAHGAPTAEALQRDYIDAGSDGVRQFIPHRIVSGEHLAAVIAQKRDIYDQARNCLNVLPEVKTRLEAAFHKLASLDPDATFPPVTILIGANNSGGTTGKSGVLVGLEVVCRSNWLQPDLTDRLFYLICHEYGHVEQAADLNDDSAPTTVLKQSLIEGSAEFVAYLISGGISDAHLQKWTKGRERQIDESFLADAGSSDLSQWLYNGVGTPEHPGDLGYWVGYRIAKAYYMRAPNKRAALKALLELKNPKAILVESGWKPGDAD